jgi:hypothetical protein
MSKLSEELFVLGYVHVHNNKEHMLLKRFCEENKIVYYSDFGDVPERKRMCNNCGQEVRDHAVDGTCP